ncbi:TolC family outer membrane protein [Citreicella sp. C3M06]|uniref:TolC family outer membrane protein n=1 Tax=Citreicella sp. C3M06 TaxID=2841564 RepID=UPI001C0A3009|nr:TolC family outer membrane protein [Citreicella sp. C3M06]MBU2959592.1 TolC family outer membrane protein [Citreicella sp. C3M06]
MARKIIGIMAGVCLAALVPVQAGAETLASALSSAYITSGLLDQNRAVLRAADEDVAQALAALRPVLSWQGEFQRSYGDTNSESSTTGKYVWSDLASTSASLSLVATQVLYQGGALNLRRAAARESVLATRAGLISVEQQVLLNGVSAFMEVRRAEETVELSRNNVRVLGEEVRAANDRFEVGEVTRTDVAAAEAQLAAARSNLTAAEGQLAVNREVYKSVVGHYPDRLEQPKGLPRLPGSVDTAKTMALRNHPDIVQLRHTVATSDLSVQIAEASKSPKFTLQGSYGRTETWESPAATYGGSVTLGMSGPIYQGGAIASQVRQAMANRDASRAQLYTAGRNVEQSVGSAYAQLRIAQASQISAREQVRAAQVAFDGIREEATLGARTTLDVLDAEQTLLDARASLISSQVDETIAAYAVLSSIGQLTSDALGLAVPKYDPEAYYKAVKSAPISSKQGSDLDRVLRALGKN